MKPHSNSNMDAEKSFMIYSIYTFKMGKFKITNKRVTRVVVVFVNITLH